MANYPTPAELDAQFYLPADEFFTVHRYTALTYDDVSLATMYSEVLPRETQLETILAEGVTLHIPIISADMDTVTESRMAIAMALNGGLGIIHYNMTERQQIAEFYQRSFGKELPESAVAGVAAGAAIGALTFTPEEQVELSAALCHVAEIRSLLLSALGKKTGELS